MKIFDTVDVTASELREFQIHPILGPFIKKLSDQWTLGDEDRDKNVRIGSVKIYIDEDNCLHFDFVTRFSVNTNGS